MKKKLLPTGIYTLDENGAAAKELEAFAEGIDSKDDELDIIIREAFVKTAEDYGLSMWEELFGSIRSDETAAVRREMIKGRLRLTDNSFTPSGAEDIVRSLGIDEFTITETPSLFAVTIDLSAKSYSKARRKWIKEQLEELLPAHLEIAVIFGTASWNTIDSLNLTANEMDGKNYNWNDIDTLII